MRVVGQVAGGAEWHEQVAHMAGVPLTWVHDGRHGRVEPAVDVLKGAVGRKGVAEGGWVGRDTEKTKQNHPGEAHLLGSRECLLEPGSGPRVVARRVVSCVDQQVDVW